MSDREESPDWLRAFQAPAEKFVTLSSTSDSSPAVSVGGSDDSDHSRHEEPETLQEKRDVFLIDSGEDSPIIKTKKTGAGKNKDICKGKDALDGNGEDSPVIKTKKTRPSKTQKHRGLEEDLHKEELGDYDTKDKQAGPLVSSRLPLVFPEKVHRSKALVECDGDSIDLSGDVGAVGRVVISNGAAGNHEMLLDLKGTIYKSTIVPSRTFCIVSVGQSEAKIEAIMNDFIKLEPRSNVFEAETMIEGTLDGYSFDSDEEGEKAPKPPANQGDKIEENGEQANPKTKRKAERLSGKVNKKGKAASRPSKTVKRTKKSKK